MRIFEVGLNFVLWDGNEPMGKGEECYGLKVVCLVVKLTGDRGVMVKIVSWTRLRATKETSLACL